MFKKSQGLVALSTVLILSVIVVAIASTVTLLSIGESQSALSLFKGEDNLSFAEGCVEDYLLQIRANPSYIPSDIDHQGRICRLNLISGNPNWNIIVQEAFATAYQRKINVTFTRNPTGITLTSWKEI